MAAELQGLISRLESVTTRLESVAASGGGGGGGGPVPSGEFFTFFKYSSQLSFSPAVFVITSFFL